jgi:predicted exporter
MALGIFEIGGIVVGCIAFVYLAWWLSRRKPKKDVGEDKLKEWNELKRSGEEEREAAKHQHAVAKSAPGRVMNIEDQTAPDDGNTSVFRDYF